MADEFLTVTITDSIPVAEGQTLLRLAAPLSVLVAHTAPGQYVKVRRGDAKPAYIVLANTPGSTVLELLIKEASPLTAELRTLPAGETIEISAPLGKGFPTDSAPGRDVFFLAAGTGIAAIRPVLQTMLLDRERYGTLHVLYGERTPEHFAFMDEWGRWQDSGVHCYRCVSRDEAMTTECLAGYVQDVLRKLGPSCGNAVGYLGGMEPMLVACREAFAELGGDPAQLFTNF
ncbi:MAG: hypothetical protein ABI743_08685 [bacterium]